MKITYHGHSCFTIESNNFVLGIDPYDTKVPGYKELHIAVDALYCSHEHQDHAYVQAVSFNADKDQKNNPFKITELVIPHDDAGGSKRGMNTMRIFEAEGKKVIHCGDIGCMPSEEQKSQMKNADVILIPVGGFFTIDCEAAKALIAELNPKMAIPMHYRNDSLGYGMIGDIKDMKLGDKFNIVKYEESIEL